MTISRKLLWVVAAVIATLGIISVTHYHNLYVMNTRTSNEFQVMNNTMNVGEVRKNYEDSKDISLFDKEELAARALLEMTSIQKNHKLEMKVNYVFLDDEGNATEDDSKIRSIQMKIDYHNALGKVVSSTVNHFKVDELDMQS